jgi:hypothetical protein
MKRVTLSIVSVGIFFLAGSATFAQKGSTAGEKRAPAAQVTKGWNAGKKTHPRQDASGAPRVLDSGDAAEVQKYSDALTHAGIPPEDVRALVSEETQERLAKKQKNATGAETKEGSGKDAAQGSRPSGGAPETGSTGLGTYVQALLKQGLQGRALADAIHAEQKRRQGAHSQGNCDGSGHGAAPAGHPGKPDHGTKAAGSKAGAGNPGESHGGLKPANSSGDGRGKKT